MAFGNQIVPLFQQAAAASPAAQLQPASRSKLMADMLSMPQPATPRSWGEGLANALNTGLKGYFDTQSLRQGELDKKQKATALADALFGKADLNSPNLMDPRHDQVASMLASGTLDPSALAPIVASKLGLSPPDYQYVTSNDGSIVRIDKASGKTDTVYSAPASAAKAPTTQTFYDKESGQPYVAQWDGQSWQQVGGVQQPKPDTVSPSLTDIADPNDPTGQSKVKAYVYSDGRPPVVVGKATPNEQTPSPLGKAIDERNAAFKANPNDPQIAVYDQYIGKLATGEQGLSITTNPDGSVSVTQGNVRADSAESTAQGKAVVGMYSSMASDLPAADSLAQSIGQLGTLLQNTDVGATPAFLEAIRKTTGIAIGDQADKRQAIGSLVDYLTPRMRVPGSGSTSDMEMNTFKNSLPTLMGTPGGNQIILETLTALVERRRQMDMIAQDYLVGGKDAKAALAEMRALPDAFATFKASKNAADNGGADTKTTPPPIPKVGSPLTPGTYDWDPVTNSFKAAQ